MGISISALIASAATSAIFLVARPDPPKVDPRQQHAETAREVAQMLLPELEDAAAAHLQEQPSPPGPSVDVTYRTEQVAGEIPMMDPEDNMLAKGGPVPWHLDVSTTVGHRKIGRILDIRDAGSVTNPGYLGIVEVQVHTSKRQLTVSGELPFHTPDGFRVITPAEYTELEGSQNFNVRLASSNAEQWEYRFENWAPATPPPAELPETVQQQFNAAIVNCNNGEPSRNVSTERLMFFYSLRERKWMPRP